MYARHAVLLLAVVALAACGTNRAGMRAPDGMGDPEILHVFMTSNTGEIVTSEPFLADFQSDEVRAFAQMLVRDHGAANAQAEALAVEPRDNSMSVRKNEMAQQTARRLDAMEGAALDRAYLEAQIQMHTQTLQELDTVLIPNAETPALRARLVEARPKVATHLERAQALHHAMM
jgi:putative membrane protein